QAVRLEHAARLIDDYFLVLVRDLGQVGMNRELTIVLLGAKPDADVANSFVLGIDKPLFAGNRAAVFGHAFGFLARFEFFRFGNGINAANDASFDRAPLLVAAGSSANHARAFWLRFAGSRRWALAAAHEECQQGHTPDARASPHSSFPNSVWERRFGKLCF